MNLFKRLTSAILCSVLLSSSVLALDDADNQDFYTLAAFPNSPVSVYSATDWSTDDRAQLSGIYRFIQYLTTAPSSFSDRSLFGYLSRILSAQIPNVSTNFQLQGSYGTNGLLKLISDRSTSIYNYLVGDNIAGNLGKIQNNTGASASRLLNIYNAVASIDDYATEPTLSSLLSRFNFVFYTSGDSYDSADISSFPFHVFFTDPNTGVSARLNTSFPMILGHLYRTLMFDNNSSFAVPDGNGGYVRYNLRSLYGLIYQLQDVLANDEDKAIRDQQKENQTTVKDNFLSGSSSGSSLGKDDFGSLSDVGGTFKDITSLNGQASLGSFTDGLSSADETGQGWFSQATKDALDSVSGSSSSVSTFSADGQYMEDVDTYNMKGFEDHYNWLWGDK